MSLSVLIVRRGIGTSREVDEALARQVLYGADLLTNFFELADDNLEWHFLKRMLAQLKAAGKPAVIFIAPINAEALSFYEVMDWKQYARNIAKIKASVEAEGFAFVDINRSGPLPEDLFADISHTLDAGGQAFGPRLWALSRDYLAPRLTEVRR